MEMVAPVKVRFAKIAGLFAVLAVDFNDCWLAGLLTAEARDEYVTRNGYEVVG